MGDEPLVTEDEELFLMRSLLKDGMTRKEAEDYIKSFKDHIKKNNKH